MENSTDYEYPTHVNASFKNQADAEKAFDELMHRGYKPDEINVLISDSTHQIHINQEKNEKEPDKTVLEKAGIGSAIGGTAGAVIGAFATLGSIVLIPPLGIAVAGPLLAAFAGAGAGGITGGLIGALTGSGMSHEHAAVYEDTLKEGGVIISFIPKTVEDRIEIITAWNNLGAKQLHGNENYTA